LRGIFFFPVGLEAKMKRLYLLTIILAVIILTSGCQGPSTQGNYTDDLGRTVQINGVPQGIISLAPSNTEIVYALGLEDRLIGVTTYCNYPPAALQKPQVSGYSTVDVEKVVALQPDLILASGIHKKEVIPALETLGIPVLAIMAPDLDKMLSDLALVGKVTGKQPEAESLIKSLQERITAVEQKTASAAAMPRVLFVTWHDPIWTAGKGTMIDDLITKAGGANIAADLAGNQTIDLETAIQRNPEIIIVLSSMGDGAVSYNFLKNEPRFQVTDALKNNRVYHVDTDIYGRTSPRIVDGLEEMAKFIHPELYQ
jgi:iron complex transport system substrate-binding protein